MKRCLFGLVTGMALGMVLAHSYEDELDEACYKANRTKRKVMRKIQEFQE